MKYHPFLLFALLITGCQPSAVDSETAPQQGAAILPEVGDIPQSLLDCRIAVFGETRLRHPSPVISLALSPDGKQLATTAHRDPVIRLWDVRTAGLIREFRSENSDTVSFRVLDFSPDGRRFLAVRHAETNLPWPNEVQDVPTVFEVASGKATPWSWIGNKDKKIPNMKVSPTGREVVGISYHGDVDAWDFSTGATIRNFGRIDHSYVFPDGPQIAFSPDGKSVAVVAGEREVNVLTMDGSQPPRKIPVDSKNRGIDAIFWTKAGTICACSYETLFTIDPLSGEATGHSRKTNYLAAPAMSAGNVLYSKPDVTDANLVALEIERMAETPLGISLPTSSETPAVVARNNSVLAIAHQNAVRLFDAVTGGSLHPDADQRPSRDITSIRFSADGSRFVSITALNNHTWDYPSGRLLSPSTDVAFVGHHNTPKTVPFSPNGQLLVRQSTGSPSRIILQDAKTRKEVARQPDTWLGPDTYAHVLDFLDDDTLLVMVSGQRFRKLVSIRYEKWEVTELPALPRDYGFTIANGASQQLVVSGAKLSVLKNWDPAKVLELDDQSKRPWPMCGCSPPPFAIPIRLSPGGRQLLTWDNGYVLWDLAAKPKKIGDLGPRRRQEWYAQDASFSPDGQHVVGTIPAMQHCSSSVCVWDTRTGEIAFRFYPEGGATTCEFSPDGSHLLIAQADTRFGIWDYRKLKQFHGNPIHR